MDWVNYKTIDKQGFINTLEILNTNTGGVYVTSTFSLKSDIPIIVFDVTKTHLRTSDTTTYGTMLVTIRAVAKTKLEAATLSEEIETLMDTANATFKVNNMLYSDHKSSDIDFERGSERLHGKQLTYQFLVW